MSDTLKKRVVAACADPESPAAREAFNELIAALEAGAARAASPRHDGSWRVHRWVKEGILLGFRIGGLADYSLGPGFRFHDKETFPPRETDPRQVRMVPGGSSVRRGTYLGRGLVVMPPAYVNVGAWVGDGTMIDSHALVGSCAQIGARVHLSAGVQVGGVLEPVGARPVIVEDDVLVGGQCGLYEGVLVRSRAVLGAGVLLTGTSRLYDLVNEVEIMGTADAPVEVPSGAVVVPATRPASGDYARRLGVSIASAAIVKYRDERTDGRVALEDALR